VDVEQLNTHVRLAQGGDAAALNWLLGVCRADLLARLAYEVPRHCRDQAEDILQDALVQAAPRVTGASFPDFFRFRAWLRSFVSYAVRDWVKYSLRQKRDVRRTAPATNDPSSSDPLEKLPDEPRELPDRVARRREREQFLYDALDSLGERERTVIQLRYLEGLEVAETAAIMGLSQGRVRNLCVEAKNLLRARLGEAGDLLSSGR
jgi:RNA polymerase sigma-70 factor (ECF subfamily)